MLGAMPIAPFSPRTTALTSLLCLALLGCERRGGCTGEYCGTLVFASVGEPDGLLPPVLQSTVGRDVSDQIFLKLADIGLSTNTMGDEDFTPLLAERWEWDGPLTLVFHLDPRARWQDGRRVTAADVVFTYDAYNDERVNSPYRTGLHWISAVTSRDSLTAVVRFRRRYPEMFYDAVFHMRILPGHLLRNIPRDQWRSTAFARAPVGDGPYRFVAWKAGERLELAADSTFFLGPRAASRPGDGDRPRAARQERLRRARQGASGADVAAVVDLGSGDAGAALRHDARGTAAHRAWVDRLGRRRGARPQRREALVSPRRAHDQCRAPPVRAPAPGAAAPRRRRGADRRSGFQRPAAARADGAVRRDDPDLEHRPDAVVRDRADVDPGRSRPVQLPALHQSRVRPAGGAGHRELRPRPGAPDVAPGDGAPQPGRARRVPVRPRERRRDSPPHRRRRDPPRLVVGAGAHLAHPAGPDDRSRPRGALGGHVAGAARRRLARHRLRRRHLHVPAAAPRAGRAVPPERRHADRPRGRSPPAAPVRARPVAAGAVREIP